MDALKTNQPLTRPQALLALGVLRRWAEWHARTKPQKTLTRSLYGFGRRSPSHLYLVLKKLRALGINPYQKA
jgi:hypothetical protein